MIPGLMVFTRAKVYGRAHLLLAEILFARHARHQALMELKFACRDEPALTTTAVGLAVHYKVLGKDLDRMIPEGDDGLIVMDTLRRRPDRLAPAWRCI